MSADLPGSGAGAGASEPEALVVSRDALVAWGEAFGRSLAAPAVVTLHGDLGAGKTTLVQAICRGYGVTEAVTSPTFALVHEYTSPRSAVHHFDLYRLRDARDLVQLGWDEIVDGAGVVLVEWPERAAGALPASRTEIALAHLADAPAHRALTLRTVPCAR